MKFKVWVLILLFTSISSIAQNISTPKLVVGIVIDQMRYDYIYRYWDKYGKDGFKKLVNEGFFCKNTNYNYMPTYTGPGHASIYTGTTPAVHGIISNDWYDKATGKMIYCATDKNVNGVGSNSSEGKSSPFQMLTTTITDELRIASNMKSKVIGIALKDRSAIMPVGHTANAAYWYDGSTGNFISSTFYMQQLPQWVNDFNKKEYAKKYLNQTWNTLLPIEQYTESLPDDNKYERIWKGETKPVFPHDLSKLYSQNGGFALLRSTPYGNTITKDLAIETIKAEKMGKGNVTDFLTISFSSPDVIGHNYGPNSVEQEDDYLRLDKDLGELIKFLETEIGKENVLMFLTADHAAPEVPAYLKDLKIPAGYIDEDKMAKEIKQFLFKTYGDSLLLSYSNQQVFLNHKLIEEKKWDLEKIQNTVANYIQKQDHVAEVITAKVANNIQFTGGSRCMMQMGYNAKRSGDVLVNYEPAYMDYSNYGTTHGTPYSYDTHVPLIFYGTGIKQGSTSDQIYITDIAPTLAMLLNIQFPNGCTGKPIKDLVK